MAPIILMVMIMEQQILGYGNQANKLVVVLVRILMQLLVIMKIGHCHIQLMEQIIISHSLVAVNGKVLMVHNQN